MVQVSDAEPDLKLRQGAGTNSRKKRAVEERAGKQVEGRLITPSGTLQARADGLDVEPDLKLRQGAGTNSRKKRAVEERAGKQVEGRLITPSGTLQARADGLDVAFPEMIFTERDDYQRRGEAAKLSGAGIALCPGSSLALPTYWAPCGDDVGRCGHSRHR
ncbi:hypothetical protein TREES_T100017945 [Tupaia chinensis]|uniref:Uncharacterized protein n=1 Tax=Tupaia chinensis TaxID=246437 RepID=L9JQE1_TUPCH|nr:hypothetical protein TREES_T100017945 [Tupaia chinensis]